MELTVIAASAVVITAQADAETPAWALLFMALLYSKRLAVCKSKVERYTETFRASEP